MSLASATPAVDNEYDASSTDVADDEQISLVMEHYRPKPIFTINKRVELESSVYTTQRRKRQSAGFSSVTLQRESERSYLRFTYLIQDFCVVVLDLQTDPPFFVSFVNSIPDPKDECQHMVTIQERVKELCQSLNSQGQSKQSSSLFAVASMLLKALNEMQISSSTWISEPIQIRQHFSALQNTLLQTNKKQYEVALAILLLRCAAVCPKRDTLCCPVPTFSSKTKNEEQHDPATSLAWRILSLSDLATFMTKKESKRMNQDAINLTPWFALFHSLSWITHGRVSFQRISEGNNNSQIKTGRLVYRVTLDLGHRTVGYDTPRFSRIATAQDQSQPKRLRQKMYHGTQIQHVWSILHHGLQPVRCDSTKLTQSNGAVYGEGVYVTPVWKLACAYAQKTPADYYLYAKTLQMALHHQSLLTVLGLDTITTTTDDDDDDDSTAQIWLKNYSIKCLPVFEATVILPPGMDSFIDAETTPVTKTKAAAASLSDKQNYVVIPNPHDVRLEKLHLTIELTPILLNSNGASFWWKLVVVLVVCVASWAKSKR